jgi:hypothetical protein
MRSASLLVPSGLAPRPMVISVISRRDPTCSQASRTRLPSAGLRRRHPRSTELTLQTSDRRCPIGALARRLTSPRNTRSQSRCLERPTTPERGDLDRGRGGKGACKSIVFRFGSLQRVHQAKRSPGFSKELLGRLSRCMDQILSGEVSSCRAQNGDFIMHTRKLVVASLLLTLSLGLGGCFHHVQAVAAEPLPPPVSHPLK